MLSPHAEEFLRQAGLEWEEINGIVVRLSLDCVVPPWTGYMLAGDFQKFVEWRAIRGGSIEARQRAFLALPAPFLVADLGELLPFIASATSGSENPETMWVAREWLEGGRGTARPKGSEKTGSVPPQDKLPTE